MFFERPSDESGNELAFSKGLRSNIYMAKSNQEIEQVQTLAFKAVQDYCKAKQITEGLTKKAHAGAMVHALKELGVIEDTQDAKELAFFVLCKLENGSQLRQELEKAGTLGAKAAIAMEYL